MIKLTTNNIVAVYVRHFILYSHLCPKAYEEFVVGNTVVSKTAEGKVSVHVNDKEILIIETAVSGMHEIIMPINAIAVKRLNAIQEFMGWDFNILWENRKAYCKDKHGKKVLLDNHSYSVHELSGIGYS